MATAAPLRLVRYAQSVLLAISILFRAAICNAEQTTFQTGNGPCAINIANNSGKIQIESKCLDPNVTKLFVETLNRQDRKYEEKEKELRQYMNRYFSVLERLGVTGAFSDLREEIRKRYEQGDLEGAGKGKEELIAKEEPTVDLIASDYFDRAEMLVLQLRPLEAQKFYAKAFQYRPDNPVYAEGYAQNLCNTGNISRAVDVYQRSIRELHELYESEPQKYAADLSCTLIDLAALYYGTRDYKSSLLKAQEALVIANSIIPQDSETAREHQADALQSIGSSKVRMGDIDGGRSDLLAADKLYDGLLTSSPNRPGVYDLLAEVSKQEANFDEQATRLQRALDLQQELLPRSPLARRSQLAREIWALYRFYLDRNEIGKAEDTVKNFESYIVGLNGVEQTTLDFLSAITSVMRGDLRLRTGDFAAAKTEIGAAIERFVSIASGLRVRESGMFGMAHLLMAWAHIQEGNYKIAVAAIDASLDVNKYSDGSEFEHARRTGRLLNFFIKDFSAAATEFLAHSDNLPAAQRAFWEFLIRKREDASAQLELPRLDEGDDFFNGLASVFNARLPLQTLQSLSKLAMSDPSVESRCAKLFYIGEAYLLLGDRRNGPLMLNSCEPPMIDTFYPWLMKAEAANWAR